MLGLTPSENRMLGSEWCVRENKANRRRRPVSGASRVLAQADSEARTFLPIERGDAEPRALAENPAAISLVGGFFRCGLRPVV
jgi:hypothetical protein